MNIDDAQDIANRIRDERKRIQVLIDEATGVYGISASGPASILADVAGSLDMTARMIEAQLDQLENISG